MSRNIEISLDEFYHIFNHGNGDRLIFLDDKDKERFVKLLYLTNGRNSFDFENLTYGQEFLFDRGDTLVSIGAWCLMDNHYHLLLKEIEEGGISKFMHKLATSYTMYFNARHKKRGSLFESCFRLKHLSWDEYLRHMFAYIHLNPVKMIEPRWKEVGLKDLPAVKDFLETYKFSSYLDYLGCFRLENKILNKEAFPEYFSNSQEIKNEMMSWLDFENFL
jgi:putative transposase